MSNLDKQVLVLNRSWQAINVMTVQKALSMMAADAATAMDFPDGRQRTLSSLYPTGSYRRKIHTDREIGFSI